MINPQFVRVVVQAKSDVEKADPGIKLIKDGDVLGRKYND